MAAAHYFDHVPIITFTLPSGSNHGSWLRQFVHQIKSRHNDHVQKGMLMQASILVVVVVLVVFSFLLSTSEDYSLSSARPSRSRSCSSQIHFSKSSFRNVEAHNLTRG
jgi:hypothetical protein